MVKNQINRGVFLSLCFFLHSCNDMMYHEQEQKKDSSSVIINLHDTLDLSFNCNQTTGYKYFWLNENQKMTLYKEDYVLDSNCIGCDGIITFSFITEEKGDIILKFGECFLFDEKSYDTFNESNCDVSEEFFITVK